MTTKDEALKLALEALEAADKHHNTTSLPQAIKNYGSRDAHAKAGFETWLTVVPHALTAIRAALASKSEALVHAPTEREQPAQLCKYPYCGCNSKAWCKVEQPAPATELRKQQEPVAWFDKHGMVTHDPFEGVTPLYTSPPYEATPLANANAGQRSVKPWTGLKNNDLQPICDEYRILFGSWVEDFARAIEAKLKEKNGF